MLVRGSGPPRIQAIARRFPVASQRGGEQR